MVRGRFLFRGAVDRQDRRHVARYRLEERVDARALRFAAERLPSNANDATLHTGSRRAGTRPAGRALDIDDDARAGRWKESVKPRANRPREKAEEPSP